jgi:amino acid transporter
MVVQLITIAQKVILIIIIKGGILILMQNVYIGFILPYQRKSRVNQKPIIDQLIVIGGRGIEIGICLLAKYGIIAEYNAK